MRTVKTLISLGIRAFAGRTTTLLVSSWGGSNAVCFTGIAYDIRKSASENVSNKRLPLLCVLMCFFFFFFFFFFKLQTFILSHRPYHFYGDSMKPLIEANIEKIKFPFKRKGLTSHNVKCLKCLLENNNGQFKVDNKSTILQIFDHSQTPPSIWYCYISGLTLVTGRFGPHGSFQPYLVRRFGLMFNQSLAVGWDSVRQVWLCLWLLGYRVAD